MLGSTRLFVSVAAATAAALTLGTAAAQASSLAPSTASSAAASAAATSSALSTIQSRIIQYVATHGTKYSFGSYLDSKTGQMVLSTNAPAGVVSSLTKMTGASAAQSLATSRMQVRNFVTSDTSGRRDDVPAFSGGGGITSGGTVCSSGYAVTLDSAPTTRYMITAGHCYANGATVYTESGNNTYGTVSLRQLPTVTGDPNDIEAIGGGVYQAQIFTGNATANTVSAVVGAATTLNTTGGIYCASGRTTGETCAHTGVSATAVLCTSTGCKSPVYTYTGGTMPGSGDSAGPFYYHNTTSTTGTVTVVGTVLATDSVVGYVEPYAVTKAALGVTIAP
jgi:hypothetical protein